MVGHKTTVHEVPNDTPVVGVECVVVVRVADIDPSLPGKPRPGATVAIIRDVLHARRRYEAYPYHTVHKSRLGE